MVKGREAFPKTLIFRLAISCMRPVSPGLTAFANPTRVYLGIFGTSHGDVKASACPNMIVDGFGRLAWMADATKAGCLFFSDKYVLKTLLMASSFYTPLCVHQ